MTAGDPRRRTGGNVYAEHMIAALVRRGIGVRTLTLRRPSALVDVRARVAIVDTIAASYAARALPALRARGTRVMVMALMSQGAVALARRADRTVAPSAALRDELVARGISRSRVDVIPPGLDRVRRSRADGGDRVLCVANWSRAKGIDLLLRALVRVPNLRADLVGDTAEARYDATVRALAARRELVGRVRVWGSLDGEPLERRYRAAAMFALPSTRESYGMALAHALAHGLPSVACDIAATREVVRDAALLVAPRVGPLADALRSLASDRRLRDRLRARAIRRARSLPTWETTTAAFVRLVRSELARARTR